jgi:segregation and condensation protein A
MDFRIDLEVFRGPLDLLLYLVRKHEVEIVEIPIATITKQYLQYLELLKQLDVNTVGDFLEMASTLIEIKSRMVLPRGGEEDEVVEDPRHDLVQRLLEYKEFKDAASMLDEHSRAWQERFPRLANDSPDRRDMAEEPIQELELWDLVSAFGRIMRDYHVAVPSNIVYDETPIHVYMSRIHERLRTGGRVAFGDLFEPGMHKSALIGMFLAVLELVRHHGVRAEQNELHAEIWLSPGESPTAAVAPEAVDNYDRSPRSNGNEA